MPASRASLRRVQVDLTSPLALCSSIAPSHGVVSGRSTLHAVPYDWPPRRRCKVLGHWCRAKSYARLLSNFFLWLVNVSQYCCFSVHRVLVDPALMLFVDHVRSVNLKIYRINNVPYQNGMNTRINSLTPLECKPNTTKKYTT